MTANHARIVAANPRRDSGPSPTRRQRDHARLRLPSSTDRQVGGSIVAGARAGEAIEHDTGSTTPSAKAGTRCLSGRPSDETPLSATAKPPRESAGEAASGGARFAARPVTTVRSSIGIPSAARCAVARSGSSWPGGRSANSTREALKKPLSKEAVLDLCLKTDRGFMSAAEPAAKNLQQNEHGPPSLPAEAPGRRSRVRPPTSSRPGLRPRSSPRPRTRPAPTKRRSACGRATSERPTSAEP